MHTATFRSWPEAHGSLTRLAAWMKGRILQGQPVTLTVQESKRSLDQNAMLHALLSEIAREHEWAGKKHSAETWKRLFVSAWCRVHGEAVEILPALDGHGVDLVPRRTSKMTKAEVSDLIDYISAWRAGQM